MMKNCKSVSELLSTARNYAFSPGQWRLAVAFLSGMVLTAVAVPSLAYLNEHNYHEYIVPVPEITPKLYEPGNLPYQTPAAYRTTGLACNFPMEVHITG
jgi:hypothetical protein